MAKRIQKMATGNGTHPPATLPRFGKRVVSCAFGEALAVLLPGATGRQLQAFFGNRVTRMAVLNWRDGKRQAPQWARDIVAARFADLQALGAAAIATKPRQDGTPNLLRWHARRRAQKETAGG